MLNLLCCHDHIWAAFHVTILNIPPNRLFLFPLLAGTAWFLTLTSLLLTWVARGMRPYPGQSNPHIPLISEIASFELKPLFLVGASITAIGFFFTVAAVHVMRYEPGFALIRVHKDNPNSQPPPHLHPNNPSPDPDIEDEDTTTDEDEATLKTLKVISLFSILFAGLSSTALTLLAVMDTFRYTFAHYIFLRMCFAGLALQSTGTVIVYADEVLHVISYITHCGRWAHDSRTRDGNRGNDYWGRRIRRSVRVRIFATLSTTVILIELFLGIGFISLTVSDENTDFHVAAILEWIIAFLGTVYLWLFCGFLDRTSFDGYAPSILYQSTDRSVGIVTPRTSEAGSMSSGAQGWASEDRDGGAAEADADSERVPLLEGQVRSKYT